MTTINKILERVEAQRPTAMDDEVKALWLLELEGKLYREVICTHECAPDISYPKTWPEDGDMPTIVQAPYDVLYDLYLFAMVDYTRHETANYNNSMAMYNTAADEWRKQYHREHMPLQRAAINLW